MTGTEYARESRPSTPRWVKAWWVKALGIALVVVALFYGALQVSGGLQFSDLVPSLIAGIGQHGPQLHSAGGGDHGTGGAEPGTGGAQHGGPHGP